MASYMDTVREISSRVNMGFYGNSGEDFGEVFINRTHWQYEPDGNKVTAPSSDWMFTKRNQLVTYGMETEKYATLDGSTSLNEAFVLANTTASGITGLASDVCCDDAGYFTGTRPTVKQHYTMSRDMNQVIISGHRKMDQYPVEYDIAIAYTDISNRSVLGSGSVPDGCQVHNVTGVKSVSGGESIITFSVSGGNAVEQLVSFRDENGGEIMIELYRIELIVKKWNSGGKTAKITYFSRDINMNITADEVLSVNVLEEKTTSVEELTYGISSNSCTVKVKDTSKRFSANPDLMKRNKLIQPYIAILEHDADGKPIPPSEADYAPLGKFYSHSWEMSSDSSFITCKSYDILYGLQEILVDIPYEKNAAGKYAAPENMSVYDIIVKLIEFSNEYKRGHEVYGLDIACALDPELKNIIVPIVLFDNTKTVWDTLQDVANFAQCYIYANREGKLVATIDDPVVSVEPTVKPGVEISPKNSFSYSLPLQSKCIVNRVIMPYSELHLTDTVSDDVIVVEKDKLQRIADDSGTRFAVIVSTKNLHLIYDDVKIWAYVGGISQEIGDENIVNCKLYDNGFYYEFCGIDENDISFYINQELSNDRYKKEDMELSKESESKTGIRINGLCEYSADRSQFMIVKIDNNENTENGALLAAAAADKILKKYESGITYTEAEWAGSPLLDLKGNINCSNRYEKDAAGQYIPGPFECMSNEFTLENGLRMKSKLRKIVCEPPKKKD